MLGNGALVISLDLELEWGFHNLGTNPYLSDDGSSERTVVRSLLSLFESYDVPVTWAIVGHLFLSECDGTHSARITPDGTSDWYDEDPGGNCDTHPLRFAPDLVNEVATASPGHEIGTHTFSHLPCSSFDYTRESLRDELEYCQELTSEVGHDLTTLVFPRNEVAHLKTVESAGISIYRGRSREMELSASKLLGTYRRYLEYISTRPPTTVLPEKVRDGLWKLPTSTFFGYNPFPIISSIRREHPVVSRIKKGLLLAKERDEILHLWSHPYNFDQESIDRLETVFSFAADNDIPTMTIRDVVQQRESLNTIVS
jgi:peptidoglycan/xylan/chitin deacetylase (PgdA/CDA1 family)